MTVANIAFLLDRLAADTPPNQQIRELTQNALEAVTRRQKMGHDVEGLIKWDVDWEHLRRTNTYKLCVVDNGDGMSPDQMSSYLNSLAVQGANQTQSISQNFGVGAKITALYRNRFGLVYQSWRDGRGAMVKLHRDDAIGQYGLDSFDLADGPHWTPRIKDAVRPRGIEDSGTKVTLLGGSEDENTCLPPAEGGPMNWLVTYLTGRYFRLPMKGKLQVRVLTKDNERWPREEPESSERTFNLQTIYGTKQLFDEHALKSGTVRLSNADAHWWLFDGDKASKDMSTRGRRAGQVGIVFQDEVYIQRTLTSARRILAGFGMLFGAELVNIYIEPRIGTAGIDIRADTARSRLLINGEDVEEANWWERWGTEFREQLPSAIKEKIDEIIAKSDADPEGKLRDRILERLKRIRDFLRPSRYRRSPQGTLLAAGATAGGGNESRGDSGEKREARGMSGGKGGRSSNDYLADLVESDGHEAVPVNAAPKEPEVMWVSLGSGREDNEMEDLAAEIPGDPVTGEMIKANADFRGYRDVVEHFASEFNPGADPSIQKVITENVREWMGLQLIEAVMTVRNLANGRTWTTKEIADALSPYSLTTVMMTRFHVIEKVKRQLGTELSRVVHRS
jgi:hypothetical protein